MKMKPLLAIAIVAFALIACEKQTIEATVSEVSPDKAFEKYFTDEKIPVSEPISVIRSSVKAGDEISISGRVMGREKVFVDNRASFILGDPTTLTPCNEMGEDDHCPTPWDACCDSKKDLRNGIASIQIVGEDGRVLSGNIKGVDGLKELSNVTVSGTVAKQSTAEALIINAARIRVNEP